MYQTNKLFHIAPLQVNNSISEDFVKLACNRNSNNNTRQSVSYWRMDTIINEKLLANSNKNNNNNNNKKELQAINSNNMNSNYKLLLKYQLDKKSEQNLFKQQQTTTTKQISYIFGQKSLPIEQKNKVLSTNYNDKTKEQLETLKSSLGETNGDYSTYSTQEATATAMVSLVRLILVILICVLLVKLRAPKQSQRARHYSKTKRLISSSNIEMNYELEDDFNEDEIDGDSFDENENENDTFLLVSNENSMFFSMKQLNYYILKIGYSLLFAFRILFNFKQSTNRYNKSTLNSSTIRRVQSEPQIDTNYNTDEQMPKFNIKERQRRHSDTSIAHLKLPPGPMGLPFLGYLPFVGHEIHLTLTSLSERYGPIYQIFLGGIRVVVLNDAALVRQAFKQPVFSGRPDTQLTRILQGYGIVNSDGALWKEQRAFLHSALRKLGAKSLMSGSNGLEAKIQNQVREFVDDLSVHANDKSPCQVRPIVARAVSSVVGSIVMNLTYRKYEEKEKFDRLIELMQEGFRLFTIAMPLDFIPIFRFLPGVSYAYKKMKKNRAETSGFFQSVADEHRKYLSETFNLGASSATSSLHPRFMMAKTNNSPSELKQQQVYLNTPLAFQSQCQSHQQMQQVSTLAQTATLNSNQTPDEVASEGQKQTGQLDEEAAGEQLLRQTGSSQPKLNAIHANSEPSSKPVELENIVARDLVDAYLIQQKKHENAGKENYFSDQQLVQIMSDIFSAGLETVTSTIEWSILFLILNTNCQDKIHSEIDQVIGRNRAPQLDDLSQMPYTEATIYEVLRRSNVIALGNAHATLADATIAGYRIPKGTQVLPNLYGIHMNPKLWDDPQRFDPSRFIMNERAHKPDYFIPFSVGRRMCLGDVLAKMEVFLFLVGLLQKYQLSVPEEDKNSPPQVKGTIGVSNNPASFRVALTKRN